MNRRSLVLAGLAAAASAPALAQQSPAVSPIPANPQPAARQPNPSLQDSPPPEQQRRLQMEGAPQDTGTGRQAGGAQGQVSPEQAQAGAQYVRDTLAAGTVSLQQSTFARTKAQHPRVKRFAEFEEAEQTVLAEVLHTLSDPGATASVSGAAAGAASTAPVLSPEAAQVMERFSRAQPGAAFDRDYVAAQIEGHRRLLAIQERYLGGGARNREIANIARLAHGQIRQHLTMLEDLRQEVGR
jgi:predicted outer membrane protein